MYYWFHQSFYMAKALPFIGGWLADRLLGDPEGWPHPVVGFGKAISLGEKTLLTNMHANTTIPEIIGCAAVYEATKITRYRDIVLAYWKCAVTDRGYFVTA